MDLVVCVGSSCHLKKSQEVINAFTSLILENNVGDTVILKGSFCMGNCGSDGVAVKVEDRSFSLAPSEVRAFFRKEVLDKLKLGQEDVI